MSLPINFITKNTTSSLDPFVVNTQPNVHFISLLTSGDTIISNGLIPWVFAGIPDGLGAYDNGNGTATVLVTHEFDTSKGVVRKHGAIGAFISEIVINKSDLSIVSAGDAIVSEYLWSPTVNSGAGGYVLSTSALGRLCSADLAPVSAYYDAATGTGTQSRIFLTGEEVGEAGRGFAYFSTGVDEGKIFELPKLGNTSFENLVTSPNGGAKTIVMATDDTTPGQVYVYIGQKQKTGTDLEKSGLTNGDLYGIKANFALEAASKTPLSGDFSLVKLSDPVRTSGAEQQSESMKLGITEWLRPEDGAWDTVNANRFYFVTTGSITNPSRLWALDFNDVKDPTKGGKFTALLDGTEGQKMLDNFTVASDGKLYLQEDVGNNARSGKFWTYDPKTDKITEIARHNPALFGDDGKAPVAPYTIDEESSGIIDVTSIFGDATTKAFLYDTQAHYAFSGPNAAAVVEGGQLGLMFVSDVVQGKIITDIAGTNAQNIYSLYEVFFNRKPDEAGFRYWNSTGQTAADVAKAFLNSAEFKTKVGSNPSNTAVVNAFYEDILGRSPDAQGSIFWEAKLKSGTAIADVALSIANSAEAMKIIGQHMDYGFHVI